MLRYHYGYTVREIARMMDISLVSANQLNQRAKKKLKKLCEGGGNPMTQEEMLRQAAARGRSGNPGLASRAGRMPA